MKIREYFKYGATIVVIVQSSTCKGGLFYKSIPKSLSSINELPYEEQWKALEEARNNGGGVFYTTPSSSSAFRDLLEPYIGKDGIMCDEGMKIVHTELHGDFCVRLVWLHGRKDFIE